MTDKKPRYRVVVGLTLKNGERVEPGEIFPGTPADWLIEQGKVILDG